MTRTARRELFGMTSATTAVRSLISKPYDGGAQPQR